MANPKHRNKKKIKINGLLILILLITALITVIIFGINIFRVVSENSAEGETVETEKVQNEYQNEQYSIGNNPTEINKEYFLELNDALDSNDEEAIAQSVVKCFITQYYTWTNKDGNYDIGGMQYIYTPMQSNFETYTLYNFYEDMDLYINQYGRDNLIEVESVTIDDTSTSTFTFTSDDEDTDDTKLDCIDVYASWTYVSNSKIDTDDFQDHALFRVVNNDGRWEIASIGDTSSTTETDGGETE